MNEFFEMGNEVLEVTKSNITCLMLFSAIIGACFSDAMAALIQFIKKVVKKDAKSCNKS